LVISLCNRYKHLEKKIKKRKLKMLVTVDLVFVLIL
jgi:hypothetical protein